MKGEIALQCAVDLCFILEKRESATKRERHATLQSSRQVVRFAHETR